MINTLSQQIWSWATSSSSSLAAIFESSLSYNLQSKIDLGLLTVSFVAEGTVVDAAGQIAADVLLFNLLHDFAVVEFPKLDVVGFLAGDYHLLITIELNGITTQRSVACTYKETG